MIIEFETRRGTLKLNIGVGIAWIVLVVAVATTNAWLAVIPAVWILASE